MAFTRAQVGIISLLNKQDDHAILRVEEEEEERGYLEHYQPIDVLGYGASGVVFLVWERKTKKPMAMKVTRKLEIASKIPSKEGSKEGYSNSSSTTPSSSSSSNSSSTTIATTTTTNTTNTTCNAYKRVRTNEALLMSELRHPFVASLHSTFETRKHIFMLTSYCPGGDLNALRKDQPHRIFSESHARFYGAEVLVALEYLHKMRVIYRDLKPENILIQSNGHVTLTDFDLSIKLPMDENGTIKRKNNREKMLSHIWLQMKSLLGRKTIMRTLRNPKNVLRIKENECRRINHGSRIGKLFMSHATPQDDTNPFKKHKMLNCVGKCKSFVGTNEYIAPEVIWGIGYHYDVDLWALGILLYEMVHGITPFKGATRRDTFYNILTKEPQFVSVPGKNQCCSSTLQDLIQKLLVKNPQQRLGSQHGVKDIKKHPFFHGIQWNTLEYTLNPPILPSVVASFEERLGENTLFDIEEYMVMVEKVRKQKTMEHQQH